MKPIKLSIKGLNSFSEQQTIDFEKLTERGLFGIFGPTGSGKSTILDGITLALYGKTSRNSSNFINTNCEEMSISYEFLIREAEEKHYVIDRTFKRNKDGGINAKKPTRIIEIKNGEPVILEETPTAVDKKCVDLMGLKFEDFIRTVVLPQGKFSEFLKLEGKPRREMLERLFNLDKYGNELSIRLGSVMKKTRSNMDKIEGQLKGYEDVNNEIYEAKTLELESIKEKESAAEEEYKSAINNFTEIQKIWELKNELEGYRSTEIGLEAIKEEIESKKKKLQKGEDALKVKPYIDCVENTAQNIKAVQKNILENEALESKLTISKKEILEKFTSAREQKDAEIPKLRVIESNIETAIEDEKAMKKLFAEVEKLREEYREKLKLKNAEDKINEEIKKRVAALTEELNQGEKRLEVLAIDESYRSGVQKGLIIEEKIQIANSRINKLQKDLEAAISKITNLKNDINKLEIIISDKDKTLSQYNIELEKLESNFPGDANILLSMQQEINELITSVNSGKTYEAEIKQLEAETTELQNKIDGNTKLQAELSEKTEELRKTLTRSREENLASILRTTLKEGMPCPVCGSKDHLIEEHNIAYSESIEKLERELSENENKLKTLENEILLNSVNLKNKEEKKSAVKKELRRLGEKWRTASPEEHKKAFIVKKAAIEKWTVDKKQLEKQIKSLNEELNINKINLGQNKSVLSESELARNRYKVEGDEILKETEEQNLALAVLKEELAVKNFEAKSNEIKAMDKEREGLMKTLKLSRSEVSRLEEKRELSKKNLEDLAGILAALKTQGEEKRSQADEKEKSIKNRVGKVKNLVVYKAQITEKIEDLQATFSKLEKERNDIEEQYNKCSGGLKAQRLELKKAEARLEAEKEKMYKALATAGYKTIEEAISYLISEEEIKALKTEIQNYENSVLELKVKIQEIIKKLSGKDITKEQWEQIKILKENKEAELKTVREAVVRINTELKELKKKFEELKDIIAAKEKLEHKLSLLNDLDGLFKGKRFVEFVAVHQLKYVSLEASKRLKEITAGNYGLEVDEEGKFLIRDYKNGGVTRDASTLSGGETFLASLSLALALSAQIQLKGTAPLELFFLDEGFGTLDDNLLDVVMNSLEKIYSDRLSVGIISHVESIKNRMPVKLIVTPAAAGVGGSRVGIER